MYKRALACEQDERDEPRAPTATRFAAGFTLRSIAEFFPPWHGACSQANVTSVYILKLSKEYLLEKETDMKSNQYCP